VIRPLLVVAVALLAACAGGPGFHGPDVPFVVTPDDVAVEMLALAGVTPTDTVWDLGSGDGRVIITAARRFGARGIGVEIDGSLVQDSIEQATRAGVADRTTFLWRDLFDVDVRSATVVTLYLLPEVNLRLRPKLLSELAPGARIVSHRFDMGEWTPDRVAPPRGRGRDYPLFLWIVPAHIGGDWTLTVDTAGGPRVHRARLQQRFQRFGGTLSHGDDAQRIDDGRLQGAELRFSVEEAGRRARYVGLVRGDAADGSVHLDGPAVTRSWSARRER
jgi:hypothetical protein